MIIFEVAGLLGIPARRCLARASRFLRACMAAPVIAHLRLHNIRLMRSPFHTIPIHHRPTLETCLEVLYVLAWKGRRLYMRPGFIDYLWVGADFSPLFGFAWASPKSSPRYCTALNRFEGGLQCMLARHCRVIVVIFSFMLPLVTEVGEDCAWGFPKP